ncbi:hypothetical protein [Verrucomicrobium sp. BvORR106]|uniref:hypothetical protein n=1 Tax=Verrucomicrobium sp. BvORR106 TaxID=1403819 RepID=UPI0005708DE0|nr:hypothetical protein [Verrucomicrobium sp. BvORR106]
MSAPLPLELVTRISALDIEPLTKNHLLQSLHVLPDPASAREITIAETIKLHQDAAGDIVKGSSRRIGNVRFHLREFLFSAARTASGAIASGEVIIPLVVAALAFLNDVIKQATVDLGAEDARIVYTIWTLIEDRKVPTISTLAATLGPETSELKVTARLQHLIELGCVKMAAGEIGLNDRIVIRSESA